MQKQKPGARSPGKKGRKAKQQEHPKQEPRKEPPHMDKPKMEEAKRPSSIEDAPGVDAEFAKLLPQLDAIDSLDDRSLFGVAQCNSTILAEKLVELIMTGGVKTATVAAKFAARLSRLQQKDPSKARQGQFQTCLLSAVYARLSDVVNQGLLIPRIIRI